MEGCWVSLLSADILDHQKAATQAFLYRKGVQTASKIKNGRRERKEGKRVFFWRKLLLCSSAHNLFTRRRSPQKGNCGGGGKSHFEVRKLLPFKGWGRKRTKTEGTTIKVSVGGRGGRPLPIPKGQIRETFFLLLRYWRSHRGINERREGANPKPPAGDDIPLVRRRCLLCIPPLPSLNFPTKTFLLPNTISHATHRRSLFPPSHRGTTKIRARGREETGCDGGWHGLLY